MLEATRVDAAFLLSGGRKAGTPFDTASTPVSAVQPFENAVSSTNTGRNVVPGGSQLGECRVGMTLEHLQPDVHGLDAFGHIAERLVSQTLGFDPVKDPA